MPGPGRSSRGSTRRASAPPRCGRRPRTSTDPHRSLRAFHGSRRTAPQGPEAPHEHFLGSGPAGKPLTADERAWPTVNGSGGRPVLDSRQPGSSPGYPWVGARARARPCADRPPRLCSEPCASAAFRRPRADDPSEPSPLPGQPPRCVVLQSRESLPASSRTSRSLTARRVHLEPGHLTPADDRPARCPRRELHVEEHQVVQARVSVAPPRSALGSQSRTVLPSQRAPQGKRQVSINRVKGYITILPKGYYYIHLLIVFLILAAHDAFPQLFAVIRQIGRGPQQFNRFNRICLVECRCCVTSWLDTTN